MRFVIVSYYFVTFLLTFLSNHVTGDINDEVFTRCPVGRLAIARGRGPEGFVPLAAGVAEQDYAQLVKIRLFDEKEFGDIFKFPSASKSSFTYNETLSDRGLVTIDITYTGLQAIANYGQRDAAIEIARKFVDQCPSTNLENERFYEGYFYNKQTGKVQVDGADNFGTAAATYIRIFLDFLTKSSPSKALQLDAGTPSLAMRFKNTLNRFSIPQTMFERSGVNVIQNPLFDMGSYLGFTFPEKSKDKQYFGAIGGPLFISRETAFYPFKYVEKIRVKYSTKASLEPNSIVDFSTMKSVDIYSIPGALVQIYQDDNIKITITLRHISSRTAAIQYQIENRSSNSYFYSVEFTGEIMSEPATPLPFIEPVKTNDKGYVLLHFNNIEYDSLMELDDETAFFIHRSLICQTTHTKSGYMSLASSVPKLDPDESFEMYSTVSITFNKIEREAEYIFVNNFLQNQTQRDKLWSKSIDRWEGYIYNMLNNRDNIVNDANKYKSDSQAAIKAIETLVNNWRGPGGMLTNDILSGSATSFDYVGGAEGINTWKMAPAVAHFDYELAKRMIRGIYDHQIKKKDYVRPQDIGMVIGGVGFKAGQERKWLGTNQRGNGKRWNERHSSPPLSGAAILYIYEISGSSDIAWVREMYPKLLAYHNWWYSCRMPNVNSAVPRYGGSASILHSRDGEILFEMRGVPKSSTAYNIARNRCISHEHGERFSCRSYALYQEFVSLRTYGNLDIPIRNAAYKESGMPNALRFGVIDDDYYERLKPIVRVHHKIMRVFEVILAPVVSIERKILAMVTDVESVDLATYLYLDKLALQKMAVALKDTKKAEVHRKDVEKFKAIINNCFFDKKTGFYYDMITGNQIDNVISRELPPK